MQNTLRNNVDCLGSYSKIHKPRKLVIGDFLNCSLQVSRILLSQRSINANHTVHINGFCISSVRHFVYVISYPIQIQLPMMLNIIIIIYSTGTDHLDKNTYTVNKVNKEAA